MSTTLSLKDTENKYDVYSGKDYIKNLEDNYFTRKTEFIIEQTTGILRKWKILLYL